MDVVKIIDDLGWPVSFKTLEKVEKEKEGWYFFNGELVVGKDGTLYFRGERVPPKVWANLAALFEIYNESYVGALLNLIRYDRVKPVWENTIYADGVYFRGLSPFTGGYDALKYDGHRKEFRKSDSSEYFAALNESSDVDELYWVERTPYGLFARDYYNVINFVKAPFTNWEYVGDGDETRPFVEKRGKYTVCSIHGDGYSIDITYGPWAHAMAVDFVIDVKNYIRPGWLFIGDGWLKRFGKLYLFERIGKGDVLVMNRWGDVVVKIDGAEEVLASGSLEKVFRLRGFF